MTNNEYNWCLLQDCLTSIEFFNTKLELLQHMNIHNVNTNKVVEKTYDNKFILDNKTNIVSSKLINNNIENTVIPKVVPIMSYRDMLIKYL